MPFTFICLVFFLVSVFLFFFGFWHFLFVFVFRFIFVCVCVYVRCYHSYSFDFAIHFKSLISIHLWFNEYCFAQMFFVVALFIFLKSFVCFESLKINFKNSTHCDASQSQNCHTLTHTHTHIHVLHWDYSENYLQIESQCGSQTGRF